MDTARKALIVLSSMVLASISAPAVAQDTDVEIEYLLTAIGSSDCVFVRNGTRHSAVEAENHLRMKYGKTRSYIDDADEFITRLASESSWTGKPYTLDCPDEQEQPAKIWLFERLNDYRAAN